MQSYGNIYSRDYNIGLSNLVYLEDESFSLEVSLLGQVEIFDNVENGPEAPHGNEEAQRDEYVEVELGLEVAAQIQAKSQQSTSKSHIDILLKCLPD